MKKILSSTFLFFCLTNLLVAQTKYASAGEYMSAISKEFRKTTEAYVVYNSEVAHSKKARAVDRSRQDLINTVTIAKKKIQGMPAWEGNTAYRDTVVAFFEMYGLVLKEDYDQILDLETIAEESYDAMEAYFRAQDLANEKLDLANESADLAEEVFAGEFNVNLIQTEDKMSKKAKAASEVAKYHRQFYLIFFKAYKQEMYLMASIEDKDVSAIEQNLSSMKAIGAEGLKALAEKPDFKGDKSLKEACKTYLNHIIKEASSADFTSFILEKEKFDEAQTTYKAIKKPSKEEVDAYNAAVKAFNEAVNASNKNGQTWNNERTKALNAWNNTSQAFVSKYVPRQKK